MFTGIIQDVGAIVAIQHQAGQAHFVFKTKLPMLAWQIGDSVAVDGCCLTITAFPDAKQGQFSATLSPETLALTAFASRQAGDAVNLEPALRMGDALGGHLVTGHVDGLAEVVSIAHESEHQQLVFAVPDALKQYIVKKGSVTLNGVSLTINMVADAQFSINLIPHTLAATNLSFLRVGSVVNLETDLLGRYVERMMMCNAASNTEENT